MTNYHPTDIYQGEYRVDQTEGISIRDYFAIQCLKTLIHDKAESTYPLMVKQAVQIADMLIDELEKGNN